MAATVSTEVTTTSATVETTTESTEAWASKTRDTRRSLPTTNAGGTRSYPGVGADYYPADTGEVANIPRDQIIERLASNPFVVGLTREGQEPTSVSLVMYENAFGKQEEDGSETPSVPRQLVWLAEYDKVKTDGISVPAGRTASTTATSTSPTYSCNLFLAFSASSGQQLDGFQYCSDPVALASLTSSK
ncbi:hypothetical protein [Nakamurella endophytica]|uniref:Uncharacterized protein n=1 Tax=Nakamurella endophytica TaxID=1748367 RepID=A0A917TAR0_9ACTN|nr:hypothetical protein [Nakamurella endophytica]GGM15865.1 hypothetical protein GCM10011594_39870 [Nakamurella endophytica]